MDVRVVSSNQSIVHVYVDKFEESLMEGRIYCPAAKWLTSFCGLYPLLQKLDDYFDYYQFPQSTYQARTFRGPRQKPIKKRGEEPVNTNEGMEVKKGDKASFVIHVQFRQNATWQGKIQWIDGGKEQRFRSTLELIKLMDEALSIGEGSAFRSWEDTNHEE